MLTIVWSAGLPGVRPTVSSSGKTALTAGTDFGSDIGARGSVFTDADIEHADGSQRRQPRAGSASASRTTGSTRPITLANAGASETQADEYNLGGEFNLPYLDDVYGNYSLPFHDEIWEGSNRDIEGKTAEKEAVEKRRKDALHLA